jgi:hypothetical protein
MPPRRLPAPWTAEKITGGYEVRDANGRAVGFAAFCRRLMMNLLKRNAFVHDIPRVMKLIFHCRAL